MDNVLADLLWRQIEPVVFISRDQFMRGLEDWKIEPVTIDGELVFATLVQGPEFHFASFIPGKGLSRSVMKEHFGKIMDEYGFVTTRTPKDEMKQHRFNRAIGFEACGEDEFFVHYRMEKSQCRL